MGKIPSGSLPGNRYRILDAGISDRDRVDRRPFAFAAAEGHLRPSSQDVESDHSTFFVEIPANDPIFMGNRELCMAISAIAKKTGALQCLSLKSASRPAVLVDRQFFPCRENAHLPWSNRGLPHAYRHPAEKGDETKHRKRPERIFHG
jgi:hypothetical protein